MAKKAGEMKLRAEGIVCTGCAEDMRDILLDKDGIENASVNYIDGFIQVQYDPEVIDRKHVYMAVRKLGFSVKIISES